MILARAESEWFKDYLKDHGGAMTISLGTQVVH
jgi:hypothetical protein